MWSHVNNFDKVITVRTKVTGQNERTSGFKHIRGAFEKDVIPFAKTLKEYFKMFDQGLAKEITDMKEVFNQMENEVDKSTIERKLFEIKEKELVLENERMYKLDLPLLSSKLKRNRKAHVDYLRETKAHADTFRVIVEQARALKPLDNALEYAFLLELADHSLQPIPRTIRSRQLLNKSNKKQEWKATGHIFTNVGHKWVPTGRNFTIDGTIRHLTRITSTIVVPPKMSVPAILVKKTPPSSKNLGIPNAINVSSSRSNLSLVSGLGLLQAHDKATLSACQLCQQIHGNN
ncbi:hypothetical protein Tco_0986092 [Tanacetum coccineum]